MALLLVTIFDFVLIAAFSATVVVWLGGRTTFAFGSVVFVMKSPVILGVITAGLLSLADRGPDAPARDRSLALVEREHLLPGAAHADLLRLLVPAVAPRRAFSAGECRPARRHECADGALVPGARAGVLLRDVAHDRRSAGRARRRPRGRMVPVSCGPLQPAGAAVDGLRAARVVRRAAHAGGPRLED